MEQLPYPVARLDSILELSNGGARKYCAGPSSMVSVNLL